MKGQGADVPIDKKRLDPRQFTYLKFLFDTEGSKSARRIQNAFKHTDREASSTLSLLVGMDLIKSSEYRIILTDDERQMFTASRTPEYFVPIDEGSPWRRRAKYVIDNEGRLAGLHEMQFGLKLWPYRSPTDFFKPDTVYLKTERFFLQTTNQGIIECKVMQTDL